MVHISAITREKMREVPSECRAMGRSGVIMNRIAVRSPSSATRPTRMHSNIIIAPTKVQRFSLFWLIQGSHSTINPAATGSSTAMISSRPSIQPSSMSLYILSPCPAAMRAYQIIACLDIMSKNAH